ncbi:MAG: ribosome small subunit-dependent GTPase A [Clostridia bacterium]
MEGLILKGIGGFYTVRGSDGSAHTLRAQGKLRKQHMTPMVGDRVEFTIGRSEENSWLTAILPRKNQLIRPPVANVDKLVITLASLTPKADLLLVDRLLLLARQNKIEPVLAINKSDQDAREAERLTCEYRGAAAEIYGVSAATGEGISALRAALKGTIHAFGGQSGVGKSSLINALYGFDLMTGTLSEKIDRGKNTTRHTELIDVPGGGMVLDTPGFSLLELALLPPLELKTLYPEFEPFDEKCRFSPCAHNKEPGCAVKAAVAAGEIDFLRYERYLALFGEVTERWKERYD